MNISTIAAGGIGLIALALAGTMLLPRNIHVERQAVIKASPDEVMVLAASNSGYQKFNPYLTDDPKLDITLFGPDSGVGSGFHFDGKEGKGSQTVAAVTTDSVVYDIDLGAMGQPTQKIATTESADGTIVTWSMDADLGMNPIARVFGLFMDGMVGKTLDQGLVNLANATQTSNQ